jgi:hypothetical protein
MIKTENILGPSATLCNIAQNEQINPEIAGREFQGWTSLFAGKIFVMVTIYADESGTHDETGQDDKASVATVAGFAASREDWREFCPKWQAVLNKYGRGAIDQGFHATEWSYAYNCALHGWNPTVTAAKYRQNPYYGWPIDKLEKVRLELAKLAGRGNRLAIAGGLNVRQFNEYKIKYPGEYIEYAYAHCMFSFFTETIKEINLFWPDFKQDRGIQIVFHQKNDPKWLHAMSKAFMEFKAKDARFDGYSFQSASAPYLPLQAADMLAHRCREKTIDLVHGGVPLEIKEAFDRALFRKAERNAIRLRRKNRL